MPVRSELRDSGEPLKRVLIADDHSIVRERLKQILADTADLVVADEASNGVEVLEKVWREVFDVVVLDIGLPGRSGLEVLKDLRRQRPWLPVLVLSMYPEEQYAVHVLRAGASGYLTKESAPSELITAIRRVTEGKTYVSPAVEMTMATGSEPAGGGGT